MDKKTSKPIVHDFQETKTSMNKSVLVTFLMFVLLGVGTGFIAANAVGSAPVVNGGDSSSDGITTGGVTVHKGDIIGTKDAGQYKMSEVPQGVLKKGGIEGEGAYHLERDGGPSRNVYLTSSVLDLAPFVGHTVKVWGQTQAAQSAGWLMDVGRLQVIE